MKAWILFLIVAIPAFAGREFVATSSQLMVSTIDPISPPFTMCVIGWPRQDTDAAVALTLNTTTNAVERVQINFSGNAGGDPIAGFASSSAGVQVNWTNSVPYTTNGWSRVVLVEASATSHSLYTDGSLSASSASSVTVNGLNQVVIGARKSTTYGAFFTGTIAEVAIYNAALNADEALSLATYASPFLIRPASLVFYAPLWGASTPEVELVRGYTLSHTNAPAGANGLHPPIYR